MTPREAGLAWGEATRVLQLAAEAWVKDTSPESTAALRAASLEETRLREAGRALINARIKAQQGTHIKVVK